MSRIGVIVRKLYGEEVKPLTNNTGTSMNAKTNRKKRRFENFRNALGSRRTAAWVIRIVIVLVVLFILAESIFQFNRFASWQTKVMARRGDVEREFQRRQNLIPNLVYAVSRYGAYEQGVFKHVSAVRAELMKIQNSDISQSQISSVKATQSVQDLISEASDTEDRIAEAKKEYNKECEIYNQYLSIFPGNVFAFIYRYKPLPYMGLEDVNVPVIDLNMTEPETIVEEVVEVPANNLNKTEGAKE
jgi:LemA protein